MERKDTIRLIEEYFRQIPEKVKNNRKLAKNSLPPNFDDLGKRARNLFNKDYFFGLVNVDLRSSKSPSWLSLGVSGNSNVENQRFEMSLEFKWYEFLYHFSDYGVTLCHKLSAAENVSLASLAFDNRWLEDSKITAGYKFTPKGAKSYGFVESSLQRDNYNANVGVDIDPRLTGSILHGSCVYLNSNNCLTGVRIALDLSNIMSSKIDFAVGYNDRRVELNANVNNGREITGSLYHRINDKFKSGVYLSWTPLTSILRYGIGCKYAINESSTFQAKINSESEIGLSFRQQVYSWVAVTAGVLIDGKKLATKDENESAHSLGLSFKFYI